MEPVETARPQPEQQGQEPGPKVELEVVTAAAINYAMAHSGVPVVAAIRVRNAGASSLAGAVFSVRLEPDLGEAALFPVPLLKPGESWEPGPLDVPLPPGRLRAITEAENGVLRFSLGVGDSLLESGERPFRLLAFNEWPGAAAPLALVAVFVTPNQPAIAAILRIAREALQRQTGDDSFSGYQSRSSKRVLEQVRAVYAAIQQLGISYVGVPASFEETGQKVRFAEQVMTDRMGNCLDLALLFASCLEQIGLAPLVVILKSHALPAVWLVDETFPEGVVDDLARVRNQIELTNLLAFDATTAISGDRPALEQAVSVARSHILEHETFRVAVDVRAVRKGKGGYRPLPIRAPVPGGGESADADPAARAGSGAVEGALDADLAAAGALAAAGRADEARASDPVTRRVRKWRERLLDLTLRNRLLNFRPGRGVIPLEIPDLAAFEDRLAQDVDFEVLPQPLVEPTDQRSTKLVESHADPELEKRRLLDEMEQRRLHASLQPDDLVAIGKKLSRQARVDLEEGGANTLFVVAGVLKWFESEASDQVRYAPLLLIPVRLEYEPRRSRIRLRRTDEDVAGNITLAEMLKADFGLDLAVLSDLPVDDHGVDVPRVLRGVREAIQSVRRWEVLPQAYVGSFTFGKFLMWNDLGANEAALLANPIVRHIAEGGTKAFPDHVAVPDEHRLDADVPAAEIPTIRDADSTQLAAIIAALRGRTFVLQGPPGTGKSQTITNLIAAAVALKKTVLFVSEKMAALEVVHRRLKEAGLDPFCLELHSNKSNKKQVLESLGRSFESRPPGGGDGFSKNAEAVDRLRAELNEYVRALHCERPLGMSFFRAWSKAAGHADGAPVVLDVPCDPDLDQARFEAALRAAQQLQLPAEKVEPVARHPWRESAVAGWSAAVERSIRDSLNAVRPVLREAADQDAALQTLLGAPVPISLDGAEALAAAVALLADGRVPAATISGDFGAVAAQAIGQADLLAEDEAARSDLDSRWTREVFDLGAELAVLRTRFERHASSGAIVRFFTLRKSRQRLAGFEKSGRLSDPAIAADLEAIVRCRERAVDVARAKSALASVLETVGEGAVPSGAAARSMLQRMRRVSEALAGLGPEHRKLVGSLATGNDAARREEAVRRAQAVLASTKTLRTALATAAGEMQAPRAFPESSAPGFFAELRETVDRLTASLPRFREWAQYVQACTEAAAHGLRPLIEAHRRGEVSAAGMPAQTERALLDPWVEHVRDAEPVLRNFDGAVHDRRILEFREADEAHLRHSRARVVAALDASRPAVLSTATESSEPGILIRQLKKKRGHLPIRALFQQIPNLLPRLKPCFLMSPLSVAQYLPPTGRVHFDLVVFDEASQIGTHDAIGVIARGAQAVIVGDSKQLPPTTFFERSFDSEDAPDEADIADLESVLDEAIAARMPEQSLGWHYRSRHESLIRFSNHHYYSDQLHVFPAARGRVPDLGIKWHSVDGTYEFGSTRQNPREARALVDWLVRALRETPVGARTFGVVTFSQPQQTLVEDLLDEARRAHPEIEPHFSDELLEHVFVKNLENVQGDERDEILFSICFGPAEDRRVRMNFGPLNRAGGERRLNVAVTRARCLLRVFSSITHDQIDLTRTTATGARHLRDFLRYAREEDGSVTRAEVVSEEHDSDFERVVCDALREMGHVVDPQVGCGGYRIDLGVRHPKNAGIYVLGVECDGAAYHSGTTARDRDRLRQSVLKGLGWRLHRVWSTDWTFNRDHEIEKMKAAVEDAIADSDRGAPVPAHEEPKAAAEAPPESGATKTPDAPSSDAAGLEPVLPAGPPVEPYARTALRLVSRNQDDLFDAGFRPHLREALLKVVATEGPVHEDVAAKHVASAFSWKRLSERGRTAVMDEVGRLRNEGEVVVVDGFLWPRGVDPAAWSKIRGADAGNDWRPMVQIAIEEILPAVCWHLEHGLSMPEKDLVQATARTFGFERVGQENGERIALAIERAIVLGRARRTEAGRIEWVRAP